MARLLPQIFRSYAIQITFATALLVVLIPATTNAIPEGGHVGIEGTNGFGRQGYSGPCPPSGEHRYVFTLRALDTNGKEMARGELIGTYAK